MAIRIDKQGDDYTVWNTVNFKSAEVICFNDYIMGKIKKRYRVDVGGVTKRSLLTLTEAKGIAKKIVK